MTAPVAAAGESPAGGYWRAISNARSRACGSARSFIQPWYSHSRIAPASCSTAIALTPVPCGSPSASPWSSASRSFLRDGRILAALDSFRLLTPSRDSKSWGRVLFHVFRRPVQNQPRSNLVFLVRVAPTTFNASSGRGRCSALNPRDRRQDFVPPRWSGIIGMVFRWIGSTTAFGEICSSFKVIGMRRTSVALILAILSTWCWPTTLSDRPALSTATRWKCMECASGFGASMHRRAASCATAETAYNIVAVMSRRPRTTLTPSLPSRHQLCAISGLDPYGRTVATCSVGWRGPLANGLYATVLHWLASILEGQMPRSSARGRTHRPGSLEGQLRRAVALSCMHPRKREPSACSDDKYTSLMRSLRGANPQGALVYARPGSGAVWAIRYLSVPLTSLHNGCRNGCACNP